MFSCNSVEAKHSILFYHLDKQNCKPITSDLDKVFLCALFVENIASKLKSLSQICAVPKLTWWHGREAIQVLEELPDI